jgi:SAM-dependent methyltransferase
MNYGYAPEDGTPMDLPLASRDEPDRLCIQLYEHVARPAPLDDADVLEVGSGRGGGASYLARYRKPARVTGVDFSPQAVVFCADRHKEVANLKFRVGDAETLPFDNASFDIVINVESSHCYGNVQRFFSEVCRVLRPGGWFLFADFREPQELPKLQDALRAQPWTEVEKEDITPNVLKALELDDLRKRALIDELVPPRLRPLFGEFAGLTGGKIHQSFRSRGLIYARVGIPKPTGAR